MVFIYINSRLLQVIDASRERRENESSWFCRNVCCMVPVGPGPLCFHPFLPKAPVRPLHPTLPSEDSEHLLLPPPRPLPRVGRGPSSRPKLLCGGSASPRPSCWLYALGPHPQPPALFPKRKQKTMPADSAAVCVPGLGCHRAPPPGVLPHRQCVLKMNLKTSQQTLHSKKPKKTVIFCAKNCGHAISASSGSSCCLILIYCFLLTNPDEKLWGSRTAWAQRF